MKNKYIPFIVLLAAMAVNCVNLSVSDSNVCDSRPVSFAEPDGVSAACQALSLDPTLGATSFTAPPVSTTVNFDFSGALNDVNKVVSSLNVQVNQLMLENPGTEAESPFSSVSSIEIDVQGNNTALYPMVELAHYTAPSTGVGDMMDFTLDLPSDTLVTYLENGPVQLTLTVDNNAMTLTQACSVLNTGTVSTAIHMCLSVSADYKKSL
jgi:hypothetical protein